MNSQINPGYEAFARAEHQRMIDTAAQARMARQAVSQPEPVRQHRRRRFTILRSKLAYAAARRVADIYLFGKR